MGQLTIQTRKSPQKKVSSKKYLVKNYLQKGAFTINKVMHLFPLCSVVYHFRAKQIGSKHGLHFHDYGL